MPNATTFRSLLSHLVLFALVALPASAQDEAGFIIISQYVETDAGSTPKGIEVLNVSGAVINFEETPLDILKGVNGGDLATDFTVSNGTLAAGEVMVIGTSDLGAFMEETAPAVRFAEKGFTFNGDDALQLVLGGTVEDTFGMPGEDPGFEWTGNEVSTRNQNIALLVEITEGDVDGFTDPSERFETVSSSPSGIGGLTGFGVAPAGGGELGPVVSFASPASQTATEGPDAAVEIAVQIVSAGDSDTIVDVALDLANSGAGTDDFDGATRQTVFFGAGAADGSTQIATFFLADDELDEGTEIAAFVLQNLDSDDPEASIGTPSTFDLTIQDDDAPPSVLVINEILADPDPEFGDANNDGTVNTSDDEFVEIVNTDEVDFDLSDHTLSDEVGIRHTFPSGTVLEPNQAIVVFGGGDPQGNFGGALVQTATSGALLLTNVDDDVVVTDPQGAVVEEANYGQTSEPDAASDQSLTRDPDLTGAFIPHSGAEGSGEALFSPGRGLDGSAFGGGKAGAVATVIKGGRGWRMLGAPDASFNVTNAIEQNLVQGLDGEYPEGDANLYGYRNGAFYVPSVENSFEAGQGWIWYFFDIAYDPAEAGVDNGSSESFPLPFTLQATGTVPVEDVTVTLNPDPDGTRFELLGNPFDEAIDVSQIVANDGGLASAVGCVWDPAENSYVLVDDQLAIWQSAFFENDNATSVTIPAEAKLGTGGAFYGRTAEAARGRIGFELAGPTDASGAPATFDRAIVLRLSADAADGWDLLDATKLTPLTNAYATLAFVGARDGEERLKAQDSRPFAGGSFEVPLVFEAAGVGGLFTLAWPQWDNVPETWAVTLLDTATGTEVDLREAVSYTFDAEARRPASGHEALALPAPEALTKTDAARFVLRVSRAATAGEGVGAPEQFALEGVFPNPFTNRATVRVTVPENTDLSLVVYDVLGREVFTQRSAVTHAGRHTIPLDGVQLAPGVYVVRAEAGDRVATQKVVVLR